NPVSRASLQTGGNASRHDRRAKPRSHRAGRGQVKTSQVKISEDEILQRLRKACIALTGTTETVTFGHPAFQVNGKTYAVLETYKGELSICFRVEKSVQDVFL